VISSKWVVQSSEPQGPPTPEQTDALAATALEHEIELIGPPLEA
jgi:hypothetical protein